MYNQQNNQATPPPNPTFIRHPALTPAVPFPFAPPKLNPAFSSAPASTPALAPEPSSYAKEERKYFYYDRTQNQSISNFVFSR